MTPFTNIETPCSLIHCVKIKAHGFNITPLVDCPEPQKPTVVPVFIPGERYCTVALQLVGVAFCVMSLRSRAQRLFRATWWEGPVACDKTRISHTATYKTRWMHCCFGLTASFWIFGWHEMTMTKVLQYLLTFCLIQPTLEIIYRNQCQYMLSFSYTVYIQFRV